MPYALVKAVADSHKGTTETKVEYSSASVEDDKEFRRYLRIPDNYFSSRGGEFEVDSACDGLNILARFGYRVVSQSCGYNECTKQFVTNWTLFKD